MAKDCPYHVFNIALTSIVRVALREVKVLLEVRMIEVVVLARLVMVLFSWVGYIDNVMLYPLD